MTTISRRQMTLEELLNKYDSPDKKKFAYYELSRELSELPEAEQLREETQSEFLAFSFQDNAGNPWSTFFGPTTVWTKKDTGEEVYHPDMKDITPKDICRWENRASLTSNPLLKIRYLGLLIDFQKTVTGHEPDFQNVKIPYIKSLIDTVKEGYPKYELSGYTYLELAMDLSRSYKQDKLFKEAQKVLWEHDHKFSKDEFAGYWGRHFRIMLKHLEKYEDYESQLVQEHEERFEKLYKQAIEYGDKTDKYIHILFDQCELLCDYYKVKEDAEQIEAHLNKVYKALKCSFKLKGGLWAQGMLHMLQTRYRKYNMNKSANRLYIDIQNIGASVFESMQKQEFETDIDKEQLEAYINTIIDGEPHEVIVKFILRNIPQIDIERQRQKEEAEQSPLLDMINTVVFDSTGIPINNIGAGKDTEHQKLMYGMYRRMLISSIFLKLEIEKMEEAKLFTKESIIKIFDGSPLIEEGHRKMFERGIEAYFAKDYLVACHLLIPQFEAAIRNLKVLLGGEVVRADKKPEEGNQYISLDGLLNSKELNDFFDESTLTYFKNLFTEQCGWNLRNLTSHGLLDTTAFNETMANRIVHAFMILSEIKIN